MSADPANLNGLWAELIVEELLRNGACVFCVSPGSRSTPLALAIARNPKARAVVHFDERGAAFHALGHARATQRPAVFVCTSGTAVANAMPAVVEAAQSRVPLLLLTADRPPELLDVMANQAIDQTRFFGEYVRWDVVLPCPNRTVSPRMVLTTIDQAIYRARRSPAGPIHINCMYREPLVSENPYPHRQAYLKDLDSWLASDSPFTTYALPRTSIPASQLEHLAALLNGVERGLLVIGQLDTEADCVAAKSLAAALNWPTVADVTSGLRFGESGNPFLPYYDLTSLLKTSPAQPSATCVLHIGGPLVSKRLQKTIEDSSPRDYILLSDQPFRQDPIHSVTLRFEANIADTCATLSKRVNKRPTDSLVDILFRPTDAIHGFLESLLGDAADLSEPAVAFFVSRHAPADSVVFLGNSMPIRDMDVYGSASSARFRVAANRGASGIDGNIATAAGYARALGIAVTAILGDLATLHDLNSLALLKDLKTPFVLVVINNRGGGIFSFLPVAAQTDAFEKFFGTPHDYRFRDAAAMFDVAYEAPATPDDFITVYQDALKRNSATLVEVTTDREANFRFHQSLQRQLGEEWDS